MTQTKRIILNVGATYGRSIVTVFMGLLSSRWILEALGQVDFGLYGVVGSVMFFVTFLNAVLSMSMTRFYSYSIGAGKNMSEEGAFDDLTRWFNTALSIHICLPVILISIGYPICAYALEHWLVIPPERLNTCVWVLRMSFACAFVSMVSAPYVAMFTAYQFITELVVFNLIQTFVLFGGTYAMLFCPGDRLLVYSGMHVLVYVGILGLQVIRARMIFPVCRISFTKMFDARRLKEVFLFSGMKAIGGLAWVLRGNGSAMLLNVAFGPKGNAAFSVAQQLSGQASSFSGHLVNAMTPAVTTAYGKGDMDNMRALAMRCCKFGSLLVLFFGIPLIAEMDYFLKLWLKNPPEYAAPLCICMILVFLFDHMTNGHQIAISANGNITAWQIFDAIALFMTLPIAWGYVKMGVGVPSIGYAYLTTIVVMSIGRLYFAKRLVSLSLKSWVFKVFLPLTVIIVLDGIIAYVSLSIMKSGFPRLCVTTLLCFVTSILLSIYVLFDIQERNFLIQKIEKLSKLKLFCR